MLAACSMVVNGKGRGFSMSDIADFTGLDEKEIQDL